MSDRSFSKSCKNEETGTVFSAYRTNTDGEAAVVIQAEGNCMVDKDGVLTREAKHSIQSSLGEHVVRSMTNGKSLHFHMRMDGVITQHPCLKSVSPKEKEKDVPNEIRK